MKSDRSVVVLHHLRSGGRYPGGGGNSTVVRQSSVNWTKRPARRESFLVASPYINGSFVRFSLFDHDLIDWTFYRHGSCVARAAISVQEHAIFSSEK